jgi:hypothetical protein
MNTAVLLEIDVDDEELGSEEEEEMASDVPVELLLELDCPSEEDGNRDDENKEDESRKDEEKGEDEEDEEEEEDPGATPDEAKAPPVSPVLEMEDEDQYDDDEEEEDDDRSWHRFSLQPDTLPTTTGWPVSAANAGCCRSRLFGCTLCEMNAIASKGAVGETNSTSATTEPLFSDTTTAWLAAMLSAVAICSDSC